MTNYYKVFESFKKQIKNKKNIPLEEFKNKMMVYFGFGGRNKTLERWISNFQKVGYITIVKKENSFFIDINEE